MMLNEYRFITQATPAMKSGDLPEILNIPPIRRNSFLCSFSVNFEWSCKAVAVYFHLEENHAD